MAIGIAQCFYGLKLLVPLLFLVSSMTSFLICLLFFNEIVITPDSGSFIFWIVVLISVFCACTIGYFAMIIPKYGINLNLFIRFKFI